MLPLGDHSPCTRRHFTAAAGGGGDVQQGHTSAAASHCPTQHSLRDLRSLHRSFWRLNPPSLDPHTAQKAKAASRLSSGQAGRAQGQFPGARCGRGLATPNDSLFCCLPRSPSAETPTWCRQLQAVCSSSATTNSDIIAACSHCGREGPGCPAPHFLSPLQIPAGGRAPAR